MQSEQQQRIMGYFIEEAKDHLNTIEQGLLNLQGTIEDPDLVNEVFRAAHSVKGGAAMLGLDSIQQTAHRLEDYFKVLKECPLTVDQKLESLFLRVFDTLQDLLEQLQGPFGLTNDSAAQIMGDVEPVLSQLNSHLSNLVEASGHTPPEEVDLTHTVSSASVNAAQTPVAASASTAKSEDSALQLYFQSEVPAQLRTMLSLFKQTDNESARQQLQDICTSFAQAGESFDLPQGWSHLAILARRAIANPENEFRNLAPALIKDFKQAQDLVLGGNAEAITPSSALQAMQPLTDASADEVPVLSSEDLLDDMADFLSVDDNVSASDDLLFEDEVLTSLGELDQDSPLTQDAMADVDLFGESLSSLDLDAEGHLDSHQPIQDDSKRSEKRATPHAKKQGPQVGTAELNSLADLFENEAPELGIDWQEEVIDDSSDMMVDGLALDASNDFSDLLFDEVTPSTSSPQQDADDISGILSDIDGPSPNSAASSSPTNDDFSDLFAIGSPKNESPESSSSPIGPQSSDGLDNLTDFFDDINTESSPGEEHASVDADDVGLELDDILADDTTNEIDGISDNLSSSSETDPLGLDDDLLEELSADSSATGDIDTLFSDGLDDTVLSEESSTSEESDFSDDIELEDFWASTSGSTGEQSASTRANDEIEHPAVVESAASLDQVDEPDEDLDQLLADEVYEASASEASITDALIGEEAIDGQAENAADGSVDVNPFAFDEAIAEPAPIESSDPSPAETPEPVMDLDIDNPFNLISDPDSDESVTDESAIDDASALIDNLFEENSTPLDSDELTSLEFAPEDSSIESDTNLDELLGSASLTSDLNSSEDSNRLDDVSSDDIDALFDSVTTSDDAADFMFTDEAADIAEGIPDSLLNDLSDELGSESLSINDDSSSSAQELIEELNDASDENLSQAIDLTELETTDDDDASLQDAFSELEELDLGDAGESFDTSGGGNELSELNELDLDLDVEESGIPASLIDDSNQSIEDQLNIESTDVDAELNHPTDDQPVSNELLDLGEMDLDPLSSAGALEQSDDTSEVNIEAAPEVIPQESITQEVTTGDLNDLDSLLSNELDTSLSNDESLEDINSLLSESDSQFSQEGGEFDELNTLLSNPSEPLTDITVPDAVHKADELSAPEENFDDLEALLDEPSELQITTSDSPALDNPAFVSIGDDSDFSDLEKLLEDADQTLAAPPSAKASRGISPVSNRRPIRRGGGGFADQTMRVSIKNLDNLNNLVGELVVNRNSLEQSQERLRQFLDNLLYQVQQLSDVGQRMRDLYERSLLESSLLSSRRSYQMANQAGGDIVDATDTSHATGASFDALEMDRFTGFHTLSQEMIELIVRVREAASDIDFVIDESDQTTRMFRQVTTQLQEGLTRSRMVPFAQAASRLPRAVRDISIKCGKQAELKVEGKDTLIDKMILEQLYDPMTHLVNNAITHGIETPEERHALNKPPVGNITIRVFHQGNQTIISVTDDGAGINPDNVKAKALQRGLISQEEATEMSRLDVYDLLFHHGFSTRDQADDFAGRGVGMDVVRTSLSEIRGVINIDSTVGQGTTFTIRLPLTLSISKALLCVSNRARIAFPMDGVEDMLDVPSDRIQNNEAGKPCIYWRDIVLPFYPLSELLKYNRMLGRGSVYGGSQEDDVISVVVLRSAGNYLALQVDQVLGEQEIVIKQLEAPIPKPAGIAGATVLGDGRIMPIADVLELIDLSMGRIRKEVGSSLWEQEAARIASADSVEVKSEPTVLIVDDSITVRELLSMTFNKVGYRVEQARDGQEAWEKLKSGLPCELVFCDIEMPRMDGLELLSRLQKDPNLKNLPIAMLTSRGADRHRQMAVQLGAKGYFTKPYLEEVLLDAAQRMLNGEVLIGNA